jgi:hypothetical protein
MGIHHMTIIAQLSGFSEREMNNPLPYGKTFLLACCKVFQLSLVHNWFKSSAAAPNKCVPANLFLT